MTYYNQKFAVCMVKIYKLPVLKISRYLDFTTNFEVTNANYKKTENDYKHFVVSTKYEERWVFPDTKSAILV